MKSVALLDAVVILPALLMLSRHSCLKYLMGKSHVVTLIGPDKDQRPERINEDDPAFILTRDLF